MQNGLGKLYEAVSNKVLEQKKRSTGQGTGYCRDCKEGYIDGNQITDPSKVQETLMKSDTKKYDSLNLHEHN